MGFTKIQRGDKILPHLLGMKPGDTLQIPYRLYSENTIRSVVSQHNSTSDAFLFKVSTKQSSTYAIVVREK